MRGHSGQQHRDIVLAARANCQDLAGNPNACFPAQQHVVARLEASDAISKFLAMLRKNGMDILFPLSCQDEVLAAIYAAVRSPDATPLAHRELIDVVIFCKNKFANAESISKTKVRGVLALLKHAEVLVSQGVGEGQPVQLRLSSSINTFDDVRKKLDLFLLAFSTEFETKVPLDLWPQIIWSNSNRAQRLVDSLLLVEHLQSVSGHFLTESKKIDDSEDMTSSMSSQTDAEREPLTMLENLRVRIPSFDNENISPMTSKDDWEWSSRSSQDVTPVVSRTPSLETGYDFETGGGN